ncbi:uncharacterized protein LOC121835694, partial [Ixodes scapularis]|uniref:uncharacterized protein LOC121835694 n=1 Tax=Ixodes scapularis TaxID=6945 RepID=UPI001C3817B0
RFRDHLETISFFPHTQIGFRSHVSTQDLFLLLQHTFLSPPSAQVHALVTVDVRKAFDCIGHDHILASVRETGCGHRLYTYIRNFLKDRTASFCIEAETSPPITLTRGTPQGAVLSPTLFNLGMAQLAYRLQQVPQLSHIFYADDLTLWCTHGSPGEVESTLQQGLDIIAEYLEQAGLEPAPEKSELLLLSHTQYQRSVNQHISLHIGQHPIPKVSTCKILGMHLRERSHQANVVSVVNTCHSVTSLVRRVVKKHAGLHEKQVNLSNESFQRVEGVDGVWDATVPPSGSRRRHYHVKHKIGGVPFSQGQRSSSRPRQPLIVREVTQVVDDDGPQVPVGYTGTRMDWTLNPDGTLQVVVGPPLSQLQEKELKKMRENRQKASQAKLETGRLEDTKK